jgi:hypothetical protein
MWPRRNLIFTEGLIAPMTSKSFKITNSYQNVKLSYLPVSTTNALTISLFNITLVIPSETYLTYIANKTTVPLYWTKLLIDFTCHG